MALGQALDRPSAELREGRPSLVVKADRHGKSERFAAPWGPNSEHEDEEVDAAVVDDRVLGGSYRARKSRPPWTFRPR